jgi:hypothetical protein
MATTDGDIILNKIESAGLKLKKCFEEGPEADPAVLTPEEATVIYRILTEKMRMRFPIRRSH